MDLIPVVAGVAPEAAFIFKAASEFYSQDSIKTSFVIRAIRRMITVFYSQAEEARPGPLLGSGNRTIQNRIQKGGNLPPSIIRADG